MFINIMDSLNDTIETTMDMDKNKEYQTITPDNPEKMIQRWDDMDLHPDILRGIYAYGFETPSEIQKRSIPHIILKRDIIAQAQSGMGKTGSFSIGTLSQIDVNLNKPQALILAPTHELVKQIAKVIESLGNVLNVRVKTIIGGTSIQDDIKELREKSPQIIVGTAGRVYDMICRKYLSTDHIRIFVLDEADEMLSQGFKTQIYNIFQTLSCDVQVALFTATIPENILELTHKFMRNPVHITMKAEELSLECIKQYYVALKNDIMKFEVLKDLFSMISVSQCIIYCNSVQRVSELYKAMVDDGFSVCCIHSSMSVSERAKEFANFRSGGFRVLISSNITARGIDIQHVSTVINFDIPKCQFTYLHRIGRSGRWGRKGMAINFVTQNDIYLMRNIEKYYKIVIEELPANISE
jgi:translation initiation factor 4A